MNKSTDSWEIHHIPDKPPTPPDQQPTVNVFASAIEPKLANTLEVNAAVIVDPSVKQVIASACDESCCWNTPTNKTSIRPCSLKQPEACISHPESNIVVTHDSFLPNGSTTKLKQLCTGVSCLYLWQWCPQREL
ncbi:uncharacterized protein LOC132180265 [Corylus avellana]|uniref:uncharacterized protein LOC132180265 n=1 Tax=Corylus avellana TaxID=13451 RepID=UPI00286D3243|nr:uncharacterized protein LOC132180265 [Corylus avellana]